MMVTVWKLRLGGRRESFPEYTNVIRMGISGPIRGEEF